MYIREHKAKLAPIPWDENSTLSLHIYACAFDRGNVRGRVNPPLHVFTRIPYANIADLLSNLLLSFLQKEHPPAISSIYFYMFIENFLKHAHTCYQRWPTITVGLKPSKLEDRSHVFCLSLVDHKRKAFKNDQLVERIREQRSFEKQCTY